MLRLVSASEERTVVESIEVGEFDGAVPAGAWFWLDVQGGTEEEIRTVGRVMGFDDATVEECLSPTRFPMVEDHESYAFIVTHSPGVTTTRLSTIEVDMYRGADFLVTFHRAEVPGLEWAMERITADQRTKQFEGAMIEILDAAARRYVQLVSVLDQEVEVLEDLAIAGHPEVVGRVQALRRDVVVLRRVLAPERDMLLRLSRFEGLFDDRTRRHLESLHDDYTRVVETLDGARALLAFVLDTYRATVSERMNEVMKVLTVFAAIVLPLTLMAGIYGMNFDNMPELGWRWAYFSVLGVMAATAIGLWIYFARRGFIGGPRIPRVDRTIGRGLAAFVHLTTTPVRDAMRRLTPND